MFKIADEPKFTHDVTARVPVDGGFREEPFKATFRVLDPEQLDKFNLGTTDGATAFLRAVVVRLDEIGDAQGKPVEFSDEVFNQVLRLQYARVALTRAYFDGISGAKAGN